MQFERDPERELEHKITFEVDECEVETFIEVVREDIYIKAEHDGFDDILEWERRVAEWDEEDDHSLFTNTPLVDIATRLESFHKRTKSQIDQMVTMGVGLGVNTEVIARRMRLGDKALVMAGLVKAEFESELYQKTLDEEGVGAFKDPQAKGNT